MSAPPTRADLIASSGGHHCGSRARRPIAALSDEPMDAGTSSRHARRCGLPVNAPTVHHVHTPLRYAPAVP